MADAVKRTIVLIHGLWMTALSWEHWVEFYERQGYNVIARSWPGMERSIEELRRDPSGIATLGITEIVDHYESIIAGLAEPPIIMGHSFGGLVIQILLDRGLGTAGVAIASAPVKGVLFLPFSTVKITFPAVINPANNHRAVPLTPEQFHYAFTNTLSEDESLEVYERYAVPGPDHVLFQAAFANFNPDAATTVDFSNDRRATFTLDLRGTRSCFAPVSDQDDAPPIPEDQCHYRLQGVPAAYPLHAWPGWMGRGSQVRNPLGREPHRFHTSRINVNRHLRKSTRAEPLLVHLGSAQETMVQKLLHLLGATW